MKKVISILLLSCIMLGCVSGGSMPPAKYVQHLEEEKNEYRVKQVIGQEEYTIQLAPPEYMACKEVEQSDSSTKMISKRLNELKGYIFFLIKISETEDSRKEKGGNRATEKQLNADRMVAYYDQQAAMDIELSQGVQTLKPATYVFENNYDLSPYNTIVVGFEVGENKEDLRLTFNDRYKNIPAIRASFSKEALADLPKLNLIH